MAFNFGSMADKKPANSVNYLKPYNIYKNVTIDSVDVEEGTSKDGNPWKSLAITFKCEEGIHKHSIFWITKEKDFERNKTKDETRYLPSRWEQTSDAMAAIGFQFAPEAFAKLQAMSSKAKTFDDIALAYKKILESAIGKNPTNMKLVGRESNGSVYATLPNCTGIAQAKNEKTAQSNNCKIGDWYTWMISPFNDDPSKLAFSDYEMKKANEYHNAKPTPMKSNDPVDNALGLTTGGSESSSEENNSDLDFDSLLGGL